MFKFEMILVLIFALQALTPAIRSASIQGLAYDPFYNQFYAHHYQWPNEYFQNNQQVYDNFQQNLNQNSESIEAENKLIPTVTESIQNFWQNLIQRPSRTTTMKTTTMSVMDIKQQDCVEACIMRPPSHYNPVCGSDGRDYQNEQRLECTRDCGVDVMLAQRGTCRPMVSSIISGIPPAK